MYNPSNYIFGKFSSIDEVISDTSKNHEIIRKRNQPMYYILPNYNPNNNSPMALCDGGKQLNYAARFKDAQVIGNSDSIILHNQNIIYDLKYIDYQNKYWYTDGAFYYSNNEYCGIHYTYTKNEIDSAISLIGNFSFNYYHFFYGILVKFSILEKLHIDTNTPLLFDEKCIQTPQFYELITYLNKQKRKVITLPKDTKIKIKNLYHLSCPNKIPPAAKNIKDTKSINTLFEYNSMTYLRSSLLHYSSNEEFPRRIFLSRKSSTHRTFNENDIFNSLQKYGFSLIYPETYSIADQISIFKNADFIVGGAGAALTNILFCKPSCKIIAFIKTKLPGCCFSPLTRGSGTQLLYITDEISNVNDMNDIHENFTINVESFNKLLKEWISF